MRLAFRIGFAALVIGCGGSDGGTVPGDDATATDVAQESIGLQDVAIEAIVDPGAPDGVPDEASPVDPAPVDPGTPDPGVQDPVEQEAATDVLPADPGPADPGTPDSPADLPPGTGSCQDITACAAACPDDACVLACAGQGDAAAQQQFMELGTCMKDKCKAFDMATTPQQYIYCMYNDCKAQNEKCVAIGTATCAAMRACKDKCADTDKACIMACLDTGSYAAKLTFLGIAACVEKACPDAKTSQEIMNCAMTNCLSLAMGCAV
jgi:hypothetical protein